MNDLIYKWKLNYFDIIIGLIFFLIITSSEFQFLNIALGGITKQIIVALFVLSLLFFPFIKLIKSGKVKVTNLNYKLVILLFAIYLITHDLLFNDGLRSIKYAFYFFLTLISWNKTSLFKISKVFVLTSSVLCLFLIFQFFILTIFYNGDVSSFNNIPGLEETIGREDLDLVNPFGLGFITKSVYDTPFIIGEIEFRRSNSFTTEPKYIALIFLTTLSILLIIKDSFNYGFKRLFAVILFALLLTLAGSMFVTLVTSTILYYISRRNFTFFKTVTFFSFYLFIFPFFLLFIFNFLPDYWAFRVTSGLATLSSLSDMFSLTPSLMGSGYNENSLENITFLPYVVLVRYGWIGVIGIILVFVCIINISTQYKIETKSDKVNYQLFGVILLLVTYFNYFIIFLPEIVSPLSVFLIIVILNYDNKLFLNSA